MTDEEAKDLITLAIKAGKDLTIDQIADAIHEALAEWRDGKPHYGDLDELAAALAGWR